MKRILIAFACGLPFLLHAQTSTPYMQKSFPRDAVHQLQAETSGGNISVSADPGEASIEVYIKSNNGHEISKEEIQQRLNEQFDLTVGLEGGVLKAIAKHKVRDINWNRTLSISFVIHTPSAVSSSLKTSGGNVDLKGLSGNEDFKTSGGNLTISNLSGRITGKTSGGNVSIVNSKDNIDLVTSGGNMNAQHCEGTIRLVTSGGNLELSDIKGNIKAETSGGHVGGSNVAGELQARTSGGNIDFDNMNGSLAASTSGGNIHVIINPSKFVELSNSGGNITLELPKDKGMDLNISGDQVHSTAMTNFAGDVDKHRISGHLNGGGIPVKVDGNGGSVHLSFR